MTEQRNNSLEKDYQNRLDRFEIVFLLCLVSIPVGIISAFVSIGLQAGIFSIAIGLVLVLVSMPVLNTYYLMHPHRIHPEIREGLFEDEEVPDEI